MKKQINANMGKFLETFSPAYSIAKGKGPIGEAVRGGKGMGLLGLAAKAAEKKKKKKPAGSEAMQANQMQGMARMKSGGAMKRKRPIDGICSKGKTKGRMV
jgi:hypothetical protein|tara:strand:+ start:612 stop:914 length:303 start_codon:yes stop_codon:yes gene_type:complete